LSRSPSGPAHGGPTRGAAWSLGSYLRLVALATAATVAVWLVLGWAARWLGGGAGAGPAVAAGCLISWAATAVGGLGAIVAGRRGSPPVIVAFAAMGLRLAVAVALVVVAVGLRWFPTTPLLIATAVSYLALLALETRWVTGAAQDPSGASEDRPADPESGARGQSPSVGSGER
jgi:hypothetical protein